jgi:hypothetical protein
LEAGQKFLAKGSMSCKAYYFFSFGDGCSQGDLDMVGYEYLEYGEKTEHASSDDKEQDPSEEKVRDRGRKIK